MARKKPSKAPKKPNKPRDHHAPSKPLRCRRPIDKKKRKRSANPNLIPLGKNETLAEKKKKREEEEEGRKKSGGSDGDCGFLVSTAPAAEQLRFLLGRFQSAAKVKLSPLELEAFKGQYKNEMRIWDYAETCMVRLAVGVNQDVGNFHEHVKATFGTSWKEALCEGNLPEGRVDAGSPALLIISTSALRSLELLRGLKQFTKECRPAKLFAKHMKVEEQVALLKNQVNIASGTPSRIKKLIDIDALSLSRLEVVVLDMHRDVKGYSLFTLPLVSAEFWDLYKCHLHQKLLQGETRICFYGAIPNSEFEKAAKSGE